MDVEMYVCILDIGPVDSLRTKSVTVNLLVLLVIVFCLELCVAWICGKCLNIHGL